MRRLALGGLIGLLCGCGADEAATGSTRSWLDAPEGELPSSMSELGLYARLPGLGAVHPRAVPYTPAHELWSNGSEKARFLVLPRGAAIDNETAGEWEFPENALLLKTFSAPRVVGGTVTDALPIETRVLRRSPDGWQYAVYLWDETGADAALADIRVTHPITVELDGERFDHVVPAKLDCRKCHESQPSPVIGVDELNLNGPHANGEETQLTAWHDAGYLRAPAPSSPQRVEHADRTTERVLGYLEGNCTHCHNGGDEASSAFDLRYDVALQNVISRPTEGEAVAGIRVVPGDPGASALYLALSRGGLDEDVQPMPPVGVQRTDMTAVSLFERWITELSP